MLSFWSVGAQRWTHVASGYLARPPGQVYVPPGPGDITLEARPVSGQQG